MIRNSMRAMAILCVLSSPMGCQLIKRLTNRGQDAGTPAAAPATPTPIPSVDEDAGNIAMPNPNVEPMPSADDGGATSLDSGNERSEAALPNDAREVVSQLERSGAIESVRAQLPKCIVVTLGIAAGMRCPELLQRRRPPRLRRGRIELRLLLIDEARD